MTNILMTLGKSNLQTSSAPQGDRLFVPSLTGLRFVAALSVLLAHGVDQAFAPFGVAAFSQYTAALAFFGMSLFFTLSGCVLALNYGSTFQADRRVGGWLHSFFAARFARIVPLYIVVGLVFLAATPITADLLRVLPFYITLTQSWWGVTNTGSPLFMQFMPHSWSISTEWFFYLTFPPFCYLTSRIKSPASVLGLSIGVLGGGVMVLLSFYLVIKSGKVGDENRAAWLQWFTYASPYSRLFEFLLGCCCGKYIKYRNGRSLRFTTAATLASVSTAVLFWITCFGSAHIGQVESNWVGYLSTSVLQGPFVSLLVLVVALNGHLLGGIFESNAFITGGDISYSIYLFHPLFTTHFANPVGYFGIFWWVEPILRVAVMLTLSILAAHGGYQLIEVPTRRLFRRLLKA